MESSFILHKQNLEKVGKSSVMEYLTYTARAQPRTCCTRANAPHARARASVINAKMHTIATEQKCIQKRKTVAADVEGSIAVGLNSKESKRCR